MLIFLWNGVYKFGYIGSQGLSIVNIWADLNFKYRIEAILLPAFCLSMFCQIFLSNVSFPQVSCQVWLWEIQVASYK